MIGWDGNHEAGKRPTGIHPLASVGGPPENRKWMVGDPYYAPEIAKTALVHAFCTIDGGMERPTKVGERTFLQARVHIGESAVVGDDCEICAGVVICGHATIGNGVTIAGNAWVRNRLTIGDGAYIGGGAVVTKDVPAHEVWAGNPARFLKIAYTHPDYFAEPTPAGIDPHAPVWDHPLRDSEEMWEHMQPWQHRVGVVQGSVT